MLKQEFAAGEERPEHVLCGFAPYGGGYCAGLRDGFVESFEVGDVFGASGRARQGRKEGLFDELIVVGEHFEECSEIAVWVTETIVNGVAV